MPITQYDNTYSYLWNQLINHFHQIRQRNLSLACRCGWKRKKIILNTVILTRRNAVFQYRIRSCDASKVRNRVARPLQSVSSLFKLLVGMIWRFHDCVIHVYHENISDSQIELYLADIIWFADIVCSSSLWIHQRQKIQKREINANRRNWYYKGNNTTIARFMGVNMGPSGADRTHLDPMTPC